MDMSRGPTGKPNARMDQQNNFLCTRAEREELEAFARRKDWSISKACRYLIIKALATEEGE